MPEQVFNFTGANQTFTVPTWVASLEVEVAGAQGGNSVFAIGGRGGLAMGTISVIPGSTLTIVVGGRNGFNRGGAAGLAGGGGSTSDLAGVGGGASDIRDAAQNWLVVAGGGGGAGGTNAILNNPLGGAGGGGGQNGQGGQTGAGQGGTPGAAGGGGATGTVTYGGGGAGNVPPPTVPDNSGQPGTAGFGGRGGNGLPGSGNFNGLGGGGGGGYYGGGGGGTWSAAGSFGGGGGGGGSSGINTSFTSSSNMTYVTAFRSGDGYVTLRWGSPQTQSPTNIIPASGSVVSTNTPTLQLTIPTQGAARQRGEWHLATSSDFVSNLRIISDPTSDLKVSGVAEEVVPLANKLFQSGWFIRARTLDEGNVASPWSVTQTFTVSHQPSASPITPSSGQTLAFNVLGISFSWLFSDPSPDDAQSAYQVLVRDSATQETVADTGKVASLARIANVQIPASKKNSILTWSVRVWDNDNVVGNYTSPVTFIVADAPGVAIALMTTVATSAPTISFNFTPVVGPLATYRVTITRDLDSALVYDSGWVSP